MRKLFSIMLLIAILLTISGCKSREGYPEYESGYYKYAVKTEEDGTKKAYLLELTDLGKEQTTLIYPEEIDGITVYGIGYMLPALIITGSPKYFGNFESENLEKLFFRSHPKEYLTQGRQHKVSNLQNTNLIFWSYDTAFRFQSLSSNIYGYNYYSFIDDKPYQYDEPNKIANVSYMYNYKNSENVGCYWVDSYDESLISFIPPNPQRHGCSFEGWYKEPECINEWNFESDITGKEIIISDSTYDSYEGIYLYAKWSMLN